MILHILMILQLTPTIYQIKYFQYQKKKKISHKKANDDT